MSQFCGSLAVPCRRSLVVSAATAGPATAARPNEIPAASHFVIDIKRLPSFILAANCNPEWWRIATPICGKPGDRPRRGRMLFEARALCQHEGGDEAIQFQGRVSNLPQQPRGIALIGIA